MKKKLLSIALSLAMVMAFMPLGMTSVFAKDMPANIIDIDVFKLPEAGTTISANIEYNINNMKPELMCGPMDAPTDIGTTTVKSIEWYHVDEETLQDNKLGGSDTFSEDTGWYFAKITVNPCSSPRVSFDKEVEVKLLHDQKNVAAEKFSPNEDGTCTVVTAPLSKSGKWLKTSIICEEGYGLNPYVPQNILLDDIVSAGKAATATYTVTPYKNEVPKAALLVMSPDKETIINSIEITPETLTTPNKYKVTIPADTLQKLTEGTLTDDNDAVIDARYDFLFYFGVFDKEPDDYITEDSKAKCPHWVNIQKPIIIEPTMLTDDMVSDIPAATYTGEVITPDVTVKDGDITLIKDTCYTLDYENNKDAGTAKVTVRGKGDYAGEVEKYFTINPATADVSSSKWSGASTNTYSGSKKTIRLTNVPTGVKAVLTGNTGTKVGSYTAKAAFISVSDNYVIAGTSKVKSFKWKIIPKKASVYKTTLGKKGSRKLTVKMSTAVSKTGGAYYQVQYKIKGQSWSKAKSKATTKQSLTLGRLKKGKAYQVRVRAYKTVGSTRYYSSAWSKVKTSKKIR